MYNPLVENSNSIQAIEWIPKILESDRSRFVQMARDEGFEYFNITQIGPDDTLITAPNKKEYFPVYFIKPFKPNIAAHGYDLGSNPSRFKALEKARNEGKVIATEPVRLVQETKDQPSFLIFVPVYYFGESILTLEQRRLALKGFALGVYRTGDLIENSLINLPPIGLPLLFEDFSADIENRILYKPQPTNRRSRLEKRKMALSFDNR